MKIHLENLGVLRQAEFELGDLTIICGKNNTGKTYATYALYGFLKNYPDLLKIDISSSEINQLFENGSLKIDVKNYIDEVDSILSQSCRRYHKILREVFASKPTHFKDSVFKLEIAKKDLLDAVKYPFSRKIRTPEKAILSLDKPDGQMDMSVSLLQDYDEVKGPPKEAIVGVISEAIADILFRHIFPQAFIASSERTGAAILDKQLNFARSRLLEEIRWLEIISMDPPTLIYPLELLLKLYDDYALPIKKDLDFIRQFETIAKNDSFLTEECPEILNDFSDIIGGEYISESSNTIYFKPTKKQVKLTMDESSSAVRSLMRIGFYLRHEAERGDMLMVDEPELNLHPENQRRMARLFARLVNLGIKVFVTTHSDFLVKELNTLIMLNQDKPHLKKIADEEGYRTEELLSAEKVRVYIAEKSLVKLKENERRTKVQTLVPANIDKDLGIEARSFDETINKMNEIQEAIVWGGDED